MFKFPNSPVFCRDLDRAYSEVVRGEGIYLYDRSGKQYIDGSGGALVVNIGHGRTAVAEAMSRQASQVAYTHGTHFTTEVLERLSATLANLLPGDLDKVYLVPGGAEAVETSIKLARQYQLALQRERLPEKAWAKGAYFSERLRELEQSPLVGDVRAIGLLAGIELVSDRKTKVPFPRSRRLVEAVAEKAFSKGLIVYRSAGCADGIDGDLIMLAPPLIIREEQIDELTSVLVETLSEVRP